MISAKKWPRLGTGPEPSQDTQRVAHTVRSNPGAVNRFLALPYHVTERGQRWPASAYAVMLALAQHQGRPGRPVWPSLPRLGELTGYCRNTVRAAIRRLEAAGVIRIEFKGNGRGHPTRYRFQYAGPKGAAGPLERPDWPSARPAGGLSFAPKGVSPGPVKGSVALDPELERGTINSSCSRSHRENVRTTTGDRTVRTEAKPETVEAFDAPTAAQERPLESDPSPAGATSAPGRTQKTPTLRQELVLARVGEPALSELAATGLDPETVRAEAARCRQQGKGPGALILNLRAEAQRIEARSKGVKRPRPAPFRGTYTRTGSSADIVGANAEIEARRARIARRKADEAAARARRKG